MSAARPPLASPRLPLARAALACALLLCACGGDPGASEDTGSSGETGTSGDTPTGATSELTDPGSTDDSTGCDDPELEQDGVYDLDIADIQYVVVGGTVRVHGGALPDAAGSRGTLVFETTPTAGLPGVYTRALGSTGPEKYSIVLPAGRVAVRYVPDAAQCAAAPQGPLPCTGGVIFPEVSILTGGVLDLAIPSVTISGAVNQNGALMPDDVGDRGHLEFTRPTGESVATVGFGPAGPAAYAVALFPDNYDITFVGNPALCSLGLAQVPCNRGSLLRSVPLKEPLMLDLDVPKVDLTGAVQQNGALMPDSLVDRGAVRLRPTGVVNGGELLGLAFGLTGAPTYALSVVAGTYDIGLAANPAQCTGMPPTSPCGSGLLMPAVKLTAATMLDLDVPLISLTGAVTLRGAVLPDVVGDRGFLRFTPGAAEDSLTNLGDSITVPLGATGPISYAIGLIPGPYTISYVPDVTLCKGDLATAMPCTGGPLMTTELITTDVLDIDVPAVTVSGAITLNGAALPTQLLDRGALLLTNEAASAVTIPLGLDGPADLALTVLPGEYTVTYLGAAACVGAPDNLMPCGGGPVGSNVALSKDGALDLDIPAITLTGAVTHAAMPLATAPASRGAIRWSRPDASAGPLAIDLGTTGSVQYSVLLLPGPWRIDHVGNPELCTAVPKLPCTDQLLLGCAAP